MASSFPPSFLAACATAVFRPEPLSLSSPLNPSAVYDASTRYFGMDLIPPSSGVRHKDYTPSGAVTDSQFVVPITANPLGRYRRFAPVFGRAHGRFRLPQR